jgi:hypothetical protein
MRKPRRSSRMATELTPRQRVVLELRLRRKMTFPQIAKYLGLGLPTVYQHYWYALEKARRKFAALGAPLAVRPRSPEPKRAHLSVPHNGGASGGQTGLKPASHGPFSEET